MMLELLLNFHRLQHLRSISDLPDGIRLLNVMIHLDDIEHGVPQGFSVGA